MAESKYTATNDFRAFCESLGETEASMCHHGIKGQRWGIRRFQNKDGTLTSEGKARSKQELKKAITVYKSKRNEYLKLKSTLKRDNKVKEAIKEGKARSKQELKKDDKIKADIKKAKAEYKDAAKELGKTYRKTRKLHGAEAVRLTWAQHGQDQQDWSNMQLSIDHMNFMNQIELQNAWHLHMMAVNAHQNHQNMY